MKVRKTTFLMFCPRCGGGGVTMEGSGGSEGGPCHYLRDRHVLHFLTDFPTPATQRPTVHSDTRSESSGSEYCDASS